LELRSWNSFTHWKKVRSFERQPTGFTSQDILWHSDFRNVAPNKSDYNSGNFSRTIGTKMMSSFYRFTPDGLTIASASLPHPVNWLALQNTLNLRTCIPAKFIERARELISKKPLDCSSGF